MGIESITSGAESTIADLDSTLPAGGDLKVEGDDHIRNVKKALQLTFARLSATVSSVASELDFAHKGGTVSGNAIVLGKLECDSFSCSATAVIGTRIIAGDAAIAGTLTVSGAAVFVSEARFEKTVTISHLVALNILAGRFQEQGTTVYTNYNALSCVAGEVGQYRVNHQLDTLGYAAHVQLESSATICLAQLQNISRNYFEVIVIDLTAPGFTRKPMHVLIHKT